MRGKKTDGDTKSAALAALLEGQDVVAVATAYKLPESTVRDLRKTLTTEQFAEIRAKKAESLALLIEGHLHRSLEAAANIAAQTKNVEWLNKQSADELGVFYGILTDKSVRILEAAENAQSQPANEEWPEVVRQNS